MKKLFLSILSITMLFCCCYNHTYAADINNEFDELIEIEDTQVLENIDWSETGFENVRITVRNQNKLIPAQKSLFEPSVELDYLITNTNEQIHFERIEDMGFYYSNGELITTVEYVTVQPRALTIQNEIKNLGYPAESGFSNFYYSGSDDWIAKGVQDLAANQAVSVITSAIIGAATSFIVILGLRVAQAASSFYSVLTAGDYIDKNIYGINIYYGSYNGQCNIIAWYGMVSTKLDNTKSKVDISHYNKQPFQKNQKHTWNGTPYDYTQPSACRLLMDKYPY